MPALQIPKEIQRGLAVLNRMPEELFQTFLSGLQTSSATLPQVIQLAPGVLDAVKWMHQIRAVAEVEPEQFTEDIIESLVKDDEIKSEEALHLRPRLKGILGIETLRVAGKAMALLNEHERLFCSVRIITDARPVYGENAAGPPDAMVITHILKIDYHAAGGHLHEIYMGIGSRDIKEFRQALDRAEAKARSLEATFDASKVKFIDPQTQL